MRSLFLFLIGLAIALGLFGVGVAGWWVWGSVSDVNERLASEGDVAVFGTFYLAAVAGIVALVAYQVASQRPDLRVTITFPDSEPNQPVLPYLLPALTATQVLELDTSVSLVARIRLTNRTSYSARNPYVELEMVGLAGLRVPPDWTEVRTGLVSGVTGIAWDARNRSIHDYRDLPRVDFAGVKMLRDAEPYRIDIHVAAEGFTRSFAIPVRLFDRERWNRWMASRDIRPRPRWHSLLGPDDP